MTLERAPLMLFLLALLLCVANVFTGLAFPEFYLSVMAEETGLVENLQAAFLAIALTMAGCLLVRACKAEQPLMLRAWLGVIVLGLVYVLGEEISWGQHYVGWEAFGWFEHANDQMETNLHNTSAWLDQKPRLLLVTALLLGGVILPLLERNGRVLVRLPEWFKPQLANVPLAALVIVAQAPKQINKLGLGVQFEIPNLRFSEMQELVIYMYFVAYLMTLFMQYVRSRPL